MTTREIRSKILEYIVYIVFKSLVFNMSVYIYSKLNDCVTFAAECVACGCSAALDKVQAEIILL